MRRWLILAIAAVALLGCGAASQAEKTDATGAKAKPTQRIVTGFSTVNGTSVVLLRPETKTNRLVLYLHGSGDQANVIEEEQVAPLTEEFLRNGFAVAASTGGSENNYGNPRSVADSVALARRTGYKHIYILAQSMGGIGGVELIDKLHPVAWAGIFPVCNLHNLWAIGNGTAEIEEAWGPGPPPKRVSPVTAKDVKGLPVLMFASHEDTSVPIAQNAETCKRWMTKGGAHVKLVETVGEHGDPSNFQPARLTQFFLKAKQNR
jgi:predicted esterase